MLTIGTPDTSFSVLQSFNTGNGVKSGWVELSASLADDVDGFTIVALSANGSMINLDIGIGAAASEVVVAPDVLLTGTIAPGGPQSFDVPIPIAAGTRIAARALGVGGVRTCRLELLGWQRGEIRGPSFTTMTRMGALEAGTTIDPGATANTKGAWTQVIASTAAKFEALTVVPTNLNNFGRAATSWLLDIGSGAAASEAVLMGNLSAEAEASNDLVYPRSGYGLIHIDVPVSTRIAARAQCSINTATTRNLGLVIYGFSGGKLANNDHTWDGAAWV